MPKTKKIITGGLEFIKDSVQQLAKTVSPDELVRQALGQRQQKSEFTNYLQNLGPNLSASELKKKEEEYAKKAEEKLEETREVIKNITPPHMRLPEKPPEPRAYELAVQEEEKKKAQAVEAQKKQPQPLATPQSKQSRGLLFGKKRAVKGFEGLVKDTKVG